MAKVRAYNIPYFMPMFPRNAEILFTTEEVYAHLCSPKLQVEDDHIDYLVKRGIVGLREIEGRGRRKSVRGRWSLPQRELLPEALTLEQREKASVVDLCVLPVSKWLYWGDPADIELEQIKRAMQTYHYKRTQRSYERMRREIVQLLQTIGYSDAVDKRSRWCRGVPWPTRGASFSAEAVSHLLTARLTAMEQMIKRQIPDPIWEWVRALYLVSMGTYVFSSVS